MSETRAAYVVAQPRRWTFTVYGLPDSPNTRHAHWAAKYARYVPFRDSLAWQARAVRLATPLQRVHVVVTLVRTSGPPRDPDNAIASVKWIDGLVVGGLAAGDRAEQMSLEVRQERGNVRQCRVEVTEVLV